MLPCLAYVVLHLVPRSSVSTSIAVTSPRYVVTSYVTTYAAATVFGFLGFGHLPKFADLVVPAILLYGETVTVTRFVLHMQCMLTCLQGCTRRRRNPLLRLGLTMHQQLG